MPAESHPRGSSEAPASELKLASADNECRTDETVLTRVLLETISSSTFGQDVEPGEMEALRQISRQYAGQELALHPIVTDLVASILRCRFGDRFGPAERLDTMSREIAGTLWNDPHSFERLVSFWARLSEGSA